jgi:hypothetical protein
MSVLRNENTKNRTGKGDARRDNLALFEKNMAKLKKHGTKGKVALKKNGRTIYYYGDKKPILAID